MEDELELELEDEEELLELPPVGPPGSPQELVVAQSGKPAALLRLPPRLPVKPPSVGV